MKEFNLGSEVVVSDPCYTIPTWCQAIIPNVLPGKYIPEVEKSDEGQWGMRITNLRVIHEDFYEKPGLIDWEKHPAVIGVDSGQCGIFDKTYYRNDNRSESYGINLMWNKEWSETEGDDWYQRMCTLTLSEEHCGSFLDGVVSSSGYGDGAYTLWIGKIEDDIVAFDVVYIGSDLV